MSAQNRLRSFSCPSSHFISFFFSKTPRWENCLPYNHSAGRCRPAPWFVRKAIYECDPVRAVRKSVTARFLLFLFLTLSFVNFLSCSLAHFSVSHFLISSLFTFSLAELLTFSISELSISKPWELNCRSTSERSKH